MCVPVYGFGLPNSGSKDGAKNNSTKPHISGYALAPSGPMTNPKLSLCLCGLFELTGFGRFLCVLINLNRFMVLVSRNLIPKWMPIPSSKQYDIEWLRTICGSGRTGTNSKACFTILWARCFRSLSVGFYKFVVSVPVYGFESPNSGFKDNQKPSSKQYQIKWILELFVSGRPGARSKMCFPVLC